MKINYSIHKIVGLILILILSENIVANAAVGKLEPSQILTISQGLSHNGVTAIFKDSRGYVWVATYEGLNRYDGYGFKIYRNTPDHTFLLSNRIRTINEDKYGNLWLGSDEGVSIYNYKKEKFINIYSTHYGWKGLSGPIVRKVIFGKDGLIYCATEDRGLLVFDKNYKVIHNYTPSSILDSKLKMFDGIVLDANNILFTTSEGLIQFNSVRRTFKRIFFEQIKYSESIVKLENTIVLTLQSGIGILKINKSHETTYLNTQLINNNYNSIVVDKLRNVWLSGIYTGVLRLNNIDSLITKNAQIECYKPENGLFRASTLYTNSSSIGCWVGSFNRGLYNFPLRDNPFRSYNISRNQKYSIKTNNILSMVNLGKTHVLMDANSGGLGLFNVKTEKFEKLPFNLPANFSKRIGSVFIDSNNDVWMGMGSKGLYRIKSGSKQVERIKNEVSNIRPRKIIEDRKGYIWIVGWHGVLRIKLNGKRGIEKIESINTNPIFKDNKFTLGRYIYEDTNGKNIWIGTDDNGLYRVKLNEDKPLSEMNILNYKYDYTKENTLPSNFVSCIIRTKKGTLWIATEGSGICKAIEKGDTIEFKSFTEKDGLSNNVVKAMLCDNNDNLWISTNIGLNKFDTDKLHFRRFRKEDGLPFDVFDYASQQLDDGTMIMAGLDGFCYFNPRNIIENHKLPKLDLTDLHVFNKAINVGDSLNGRVVLYKSLGDIRKLNLKYNENVFSFNVNSLHYSNPENYLLRYRLLPLNEKWISAPSNRRSFHYNGLQSGVYTLEVQASNVFGEWTNTHTLIISINQPWYKTIGAILIYIFTIIVVVLVVVRIRLNTQYLKHTIEIEQLEKSKSRAVSEAKFKFFSNIAHEFKTPLTLISGPIDILINRHKDDNESYNKLTLVKRQAGKMSQLVDQVHDFQKIDKNLLKMNYEQFKFNSFIKDLITDFEYLATENNKKILLKGNKADVFVSADKDKIEKIINNLLNNAFKFTKAGDVITISYRVEDKNLNLKVEDTGKGIDEVDLPHVFERFYQSQKKHSQYTGGSGIGLAFSKRLVEMHYGYISVESEFGKGTTFDLRLPIVKNTVDNTYEKESMILEIERQHEEDATINMGFDFNSIKVNEDIKDTLIYLVEDNDDMRHFTDESLSNYFRVRAFTNGKECISEMENEWPDIILSDVLMPELNGFELCKKIKSDIKTSHIPVVLLTACTTSEDKIKGLEIGADAYITKPYDLKHLVSTVENILKGRKKLRERYQSDFPLSLEKKMVGKEDSIFLEKLYALMMENLDNQDLDLDNLARELYLNRTHFYQKIKLLTNQTPFELLKSYRLKKAAELLKKGDLSVTEVCEQTGFKSRTHFSKVFKIQYGLTPGKYSSNAKEDMSN